MTESNDGPGEDTGTEAPRALRLITGALYIGLIGANLYLVFDWWRDTPSGAETLARWKAKAQECEGCAKRKATLRAAFNRMHWQAEQILEGEEIETQPEPAPGES